MTKEVDVIVVGYGLAGAVAAIEAHDHQAEVVILEKGQYPGGCSILAGGALLCASDVEQAAKYLKSISGDRLDENLIWSFAKDLSENEEYLRKLTKCNNGEVRPYHFDENDIWFGTYPYPFEGRNSLYVSTVNNIPGFDGDFPWLQRMRPMGVNLMKTAMDNVEKRHIEVNLCSPAKRIISKSNTLIAGVTIDTMSGESVILARRAVILACGGFEQNTTMQLQYLQGKPFYSVAPLTHTGDGIQMAQKVGAALWHMWHIHGSYGFKRPEFPIAFRHTFGGARNPKHIMPWIVIDKFGRRYMNECPPAPQDTAHRPMEIYDPDMPGYPRIPSFLIFDENGRKRGPLAEPLAVGQRIYDWSKDNVEEINKGWIIRAESLESLHSIIYETKENEGKILLNVFLETIAEWNKSATNGSDWLGRPKSTMIPIDAPPYYAIPVWPIITNTQGGPMHNVRQQVIDAFGDPIPKLYCVGELGSFFGHLYQLAGNLAECLSSGRTAGKYAAMEGCNW